MTAAPARRAIPAKPTTYRGQRFRSALEARWAVFFDDQEIIWNYEPEKFALTSGVYIPDFHLRWASGASVWAEVKPGIWDLDDHDLRRHAEFAAGDRVLVLLDGLPEARAYCMVGARWGILLGARGPERMSLTTEVDDARLQASCRRAAGVRFKRK